MAKRAATHRLADILPLPAAPAQRRIVTAVIDALRAAAPGIAALSPDAPWGASNAEAVSAALRARLDDLEDVRAAEAWVHHVIDRATYAGIWCHQTATRRLSIEPDRGVLRPGDRVLLAEADARIDRFLSQLPHMPKALSPNARLGMAIVAAADFSAVLQTAQLEQIPDLACGLRRHGEWVWLDFALGDREAPWRSVRRWFLDPVSLLLLARESPWPTRRPTAEQALAALVKETGWPPLTLASLTRSARARWATRLPRYLLDYALSPTVSVSLPDPAWQRLCIGKRLRADDSPLPVRSVARAAYVGQAFAQRPASRDGLAMETAIRALARVLRRQGREKRRTRRQIQDRWNAWQAEHGHLGGWVTLMGGWAHTAVLRADNAKGPRSPGMLRYIEAIGLRWIRLFSLLPPDAAANDEGEFAHRLEMLRTDLSRMGSAGVAAAAVRDFAEYVEAAGGPIIPLDSDWRDTAGARAVDATLITGSEYRALRRWLADALGEGTFACKRAWVMLAIAYRSGLRWTELASLRFRDVIVLDGEALAALQAKPRPGEEGRHVIGAIGVRANAYSRGKSRHAKRRFAIEHVLNSGEAAELADYVRLARQLGGAIRPEDHPIFADVAALDRPPDVEQTHDLIQRGMRAVTGDQSLVFHSLRHAAATWWFVRLVLEPLATGTTLERLRDWADSASLTPSGEAAMTWLTGRQPDDPSVLYVISQALGHADPAETVRSYIHLLDLALALAVKRHLRVPQQTEAVIDGVQTASVWRRRRRASSA